jgi:CRISPR-associated protein Cas5h
MRTIAFDVQGPYGHFRKPYAPVSPVTYPFPPPPTVLGLVGAILGYGKEEYLERIGWEQVRVAVQLLNPVRKYRTTLNLINTKDNEFFRLKGENPRSQIPYEFLKDPAFRIWVAEGTDEAMDDLETLLQEEKTVYTPALGLAQCLADVSFVGVKDAEPLGMGEYSIVSVVPHDLDACHFEPRHRYVRYRVPARMRPDRVVEDYRETVVDEGEKVGAITVDTDKAWRVGDAYILFF